MIDRANAADSNILFRWRAPLKAITVRDNHFVNLGGWSSSNTEKQDIEISDYSENNEMCRNRVVCGLETNQVPTR